MLDVDGSKGPADPNEAHEDALTKGKDQPPFTLSEGANKGAPETEPFKITNAG